MDYRELFRIAKTALKMEMLRLKNYFGGPGMSVL